MANEANLSKSVVLSHDSVAIARLTGWSLEVNKEPVDITSFDSQSWKEFLVDMKEWNMSFDGIVVRSGAGNYEVILDDIITNDTAVTVSLVDSDGTLTTTSGDGFIIGVSLTGSLGDKQTMSGKIQGTGVLALTA